MTVDSPPLWLRTFRGLTSILGLIFFPLGRFGKVRGNPSTSTRRSVGLVVVLPGIEGRSFLNRSLVRGLIEGGTRSAVEIWDWTTGIVLLFPFHLRSRRYQQAIAQRYAERIAEYQREHPGCPVQLIGHSGGGGMALLILEALAGRRESVSAILLGPAVSPRFDVDKAARGCGGIVHFYSPLDVVFLGIATLMMGTMDARYSFSAGAVGFRRTDADSGGANDDFRQVRYHPAMVAQFNLGGHFGWTNRVFAAETLAPLVREGESRSVPETAT